jgi:Ca-activated chloride channel family protein
MINFAQAQYLLLIFLIPVFFVMQAVLLRLRRKRIRKFGDESLVNQMMPSYSKSKVWVRQTLYSVAFFFFVIGLARPQIGARLKEQEVKGAEIIIAMDVSNSMLAEDYSPNRLERAKLAVSRLVDKLRDDRIGLVIFAGTSFVQLPVTTDYVSAKMFLNSIDSGSIPIQGTALGDALKTCIRSFSQQSDKSRAIILITDGENHEDDPVAVAKEAADMGIKVFAIGVGSPEGKPIPMNGELLKDKDGEIVVSRLDEEVLQEIAQAGNGVYVRAGNNEFGLNPIIDDLRKLEDEKYNSVVFEEYDEQFMYFLAIALCFFVLEMLVGDRRSKRHLFQR